MNTDTQAHELSHESMPKFCHNCGVALEERGAFCSACGTPVESGVAPTQQDSHSAAVSVALEADRRMRFRLGLTGAALGVILLGIVVALANRSPQPNRPAIITHGPDYDKPASPPQAERSDAIATNNPKAPASVQHETVPSPAVDRGGSEDRELREDGRVYSVALIVATPGIPSGAKLFAQGRVLSFDYASGMRSRRFAIIEDEQQPGKTLMCAMIGEEGEQVFSLYHIGEVVAVSGEYLDTVGVNGYPRVALANCHVAGPQGNVVRPAPPTNDKPVPVETPPQTAELFIAGSNCSYLSMDFDTGVPLDDARMCVAEASPKMTNGSKVTFILSCDGRLATCMKLSFGQTYEVESVNNNQYPECGKPSEKTMCVKVHARPYDLIYTMMVKIDCNDKANQSPGSAAYEECRAK